MDELDTLRKEFDVKEQLLVDKLYAARYDELIFADTPFKCPHCSGDFYKVYDYRKLHKAHFKFWEYIGLYSYLVGPALISAINKYIESKCGATHREYEAAEADLIAEIEIQHDYVAKRAMRKYNYAGDLRLLYRLKRFCGLIDSRHPSVWVLNALAGR